MKIPQPWLDTLAAIQQIAPEAVIGGGCLRDLDNDRPVKDVDIFVNGTKLDHLYQVHAKLRESGFDVEEIDDESHYPVGDGNDVVGFFEMHAPDVVEPVQIIMVNFDCSRIVERFDYGICRISHDGETLFRAPEYLIDQHDKIFRLRRQRNDTELVASVHRYARLVQKYPGWGFRPFAMDDLDDLMCVDDYRGTGAPS